MSIRFFVVRRRYLALLFAVLASAAIFAAVNAPLAMTASAVARQLPIYCVQRDQKVCSVSFDAAWGADNTQKVLDVLDVFFRILGVGVGVNGALGNPEFLVAVLLGLVVPVYVFHGDKVIGITVDEEHGHGRLFKLLQGRCLPEGPAVFFLGNQRCALENISWDIPEGVLEVAVELGNH